MIEILVHLGSHSDPPSFCWTRRRQVAPGGQGDLLQRADIDQGATLSQAEFTVLGQLLGLETGNVQLLFGLLPRACNGRVWQGGGLIDYPLVICHVAFLNMAIFDGKTYYINGYLQQLCEITRG